MAQSDTDAGDSETTPNTDEQPDTLPDTVEVEILYTVGGHRRGADVDPESWRWTAAEDVATYGTDVLEECGHDPERVMTEAFESLGTAELPTGDIDSVGRFLEEIYRQCQGGRVYDHLPYDGRKHRSMSKGDVIVVDGDRHMVASFGFSRLDW